MVTRGAQSLMFSIWLWTDLHINVLFDLKYL